MKDKITLKINKEDKTMGYLYLPNHPGPKRLGVSKKTIKLFDLVPGYVGPDIYLDFNENSELIGIEIIG